MKDDPLLPVTSPDVGVAADGDIPGVNEEQPQTLQQLRQRRKSAAPAAAAEEAADDVSSTSSSGSSHNSRHRAKERTLQANQHVTTGKFVMLLVLAMSTAVISIAVFLYIKNAERESFREQYKNDAEKVFVQVRQSLGLILNEIDSYVVGLVAYTLSRENDDGWPYVTVPNFAVQAAKMRTLTRAFSVQQYHRISEDQIEPWEEYTAANDGWLNESLKIQFEDPTFSGKLLESYNGGAAKLFTLDEPPRDKSGDIMLFPKWQSSPVIPIWDPYNWDLSRLSIFFDLVLPELLQHKAMVSPVSNIPLDDTEESLEVAQSNIDWFAQLLDEKEDPASPSSSLYYPILSYAADTVLHTNGSATAPDNDTGARDTDELIGVYSVDFFWKDLFRDILPVGSNGLISVVSNTCGQSFTFELDGPEVELLGTSDLHDPNYDDMGRNTTLHEKVVTAALELGRDRCCFNLTVYPSARFEERFYTKEPTIFAVAVMLTFVVSAAFFLLYDFLVESRQRTVQLNALRAQNATDKAKLILDNARQATRAERELNDFIAHEVRNPVSAAMAACSFVKAAIDDLHNPETIQTVREDVQVIDHSLSFVADLLRNMLDMHRAADKKLKIELQPVDILTDILEPSGGMLYRRSDDVKLLIDCPSNLVVETDRMRLKQVVLNLGRNSSKFISQGYIRLKARVSPDDGTVEIFVEDSGVGVPEEKRKGLFQKFQDSLDVLSQGTGIGLFLCKNLVDLMEGDIFLDENFESGVEGCPGTRIVIRLNKKPSNLLDSVGHDDDDDDKEEATDEKKTPDGDKEETTPRRAELSKGKGQASSYTLPDCRRVLFVDDDAMLRKLFSRSIKRVCPNWTCQEAGNGEAALLLVEQDQEFDLMFVDQYMASVEKQLLGTETVRELRNRGVNCQIVGLSANDKKDEFLKAGADGFMFKPFPCKAELLKAELEELLSKPRGRKNGQMIKEL